MLQCNTHSHSRHVAGISECVHFNTRGLTASMCNNYVASLWETNVKQMSQSFNSEHFGLTNTASCSVGGDISLGKNLFFSYLPFTESWRSKLCLTYFFCCSRWNIVTHSGGNLETHVFNYEPRLQQEKRWVEKHSLMSGLELNLSELFMELVN